MKRLINTLLVLFFICLVPSTALASSDVYRLYNFQSDEHLYTTDANEKDTLKRGGWRYEGTGWVTADQSSEPVYRLYSPVTHEHLYTKDTNEVNTLTQNHGWTLDNNGNALFYSNGSIPIYRLYNEGTKLHLLSTDQNEYDTLRNSGWNDEGVALYADATGTPLPASASSFEPGKRTVKNFLLAAMLPVGTTNYIWGGGWDEADQGAGIDAVTIGASPTWKSFFDRQDGNYDYNTTKYQIHNGLDCSGYVGWTVYNTLNKTGGGSGEVHYADEDAQIFANKGYGTYTPYQQVREFLPGDIVSLNEDGHVYMVVGTCPDGSVLIAHSSPPGVMLTGVKNADGSQNQATELSRRYMQRYFPEYYNRYNSKLDRDHFYVERCSKMSWSPNVVGDPDGIRNLDAESVLKVLFNE